MTWARWKNGGQTVTQGQGQVTLFPWTALASSQAYFGLWAANDGPDPVTIAFQPSNEGANPDVDSDNRVLLAGQSWMLTLDNDRHYAWRIVASSAGTSGVRWGIDTP